MTTTASVYYNRIDVNYPSAGRDNDSQGFRDNFNNIKLSLKSTDELVSTLKLGMVTTATTNDFGFNKLKRVNFQDCSVNIYDDTTNVRSQSVAVNYSNGSYQKFKVAGGTTVFNVINWPYKSGLNTNENLCGSIIISITPDSAALTTINFNNYIPVGETSIPFTFDSTLTAFFELWTDDGGTTVYVNQIGYKTGIVATGTTLIASDSIKIGTNTYRTGTNYKTVVYVDTGTNVKVGDLAVLRNVYKTEIDPATEYQVGSSSSNHFVVSDSTGIFKGATINFTGTNTAYIVDSIVPGNNTSTNTATVYTTGYFDVDPAPFSTGSVVTFANPTFDELPIVLTWSTGTVSSTTGTSGDYKGTIYADSSTLYVAYDDYANTTTNWTKFYNDTYIDDTVANIVAPRQLSTGTTAETVSTATDSDVLATTAFVHNVLPMGAIIMWWGRVDSIPSGWFLCDGTNSTPDLRGRFVIGANADNGTYPTTNITGTSTTLGGWKDAIVVQHNHTATIVDPGHVHGNGAIYPYNDTGTQAEQNQDPAGPASFTSFNVDTTTATTGITVGTDQYGEPGSNRNLPPFYALCYIMKAI